MDPAWSYRKLENFIQRSGGQIKNTLLSDEYTFEKWQADNDPGRSVPVFAIDDSQRLHWFTTDAELIPLSGWKVYALAVQPNGDDS